MTEPPAIRDLPYTKATLPNGLDVIARRQGDLPIVAVNLWYHVGSKNEERSRRGFAHLFEHLMFEGSEHYPGDFFKPLQRLGANINGSTSADRTNYFADLPTAHLPLALAMESDRMGHFLPALSDEKLRIQKDVVKNEYRQNYANRPYGQAWRILSEALYPTDHPYSWLTIGLMEDVEAANRDDVEAFFRRFYVPSNASLAIVGDVDEAEAIDLAARYFGDLPGGTKAIRPWAPSPDPSRWNGTLVYRDRVELDRLYLAWPTVAQFEADDAPLAILSDVLTRGKSGRLYQRLVVEEGLAQDVATHQSGRELAGSFAAIVTLRPGKSWERAREIVDAEVAAIAENGPSPEELSRVQNGRLAGLIYALDNIGGFGGVADRLNAYNTFLGDPGRIVTDLERFRAVTPEAVADVARRYVADRPRVELAVVRRPTASVRLDRTTPPDPGPSVAFRAPRPEERRLACGVPLWVVPRRDLPIVAMTCVVKAGSGVHGPERGGLASLTADLMDEGTHTRTSRQIAQIAEGLGTHLSSNAGWDGSYVGMQCLTPHLDASLDLAADVLLNPAFPPEDFDRVKGQTLAGLKAQREQAEARASKALISALYPEAHPYRVPSDGTEATVAGLTRDDLRVFHSSQYAPGRSAIVVAGDVDPDDLARRLDARLSGWSANGEEAAPGLDAARSRSPRMILLDRPGAAQAVVRVGHVGTDRLDADYSALMLFNQILGGQFTSRLNAKLREEKGFTYGVRSGFDFRRGPGPFAIAASLQSDRLDEALDDLRREVVALLGDRPPTEAELTDARRALIEGQARHFETPSALVARYAGLYLYGLPPDHHAGFADRLEFVTLEAMIEASRRHIDPSALVAVVVADAESVAPGLERLGWAAVERVDEGAEEGPDVGP
ncbi:MAG TPA: pitrilysin family protein [Isosphaeraceae bacterium]